MNRADEMLEYFNDGKRWHQGDFYNEDGTKFCLLGASLLLDNYKFNMRSQHALDMIRRVVAEQYFDRLASRPCQDAIPAFNDHQDTTWDDVQAVLEKVSARLDEGIM